MSSTTALFSIINGLLLRTLPVQAPEELAIITRRNSLLPDSWATEAFSYPIYEHFQRNSKSMASIAAFRGNPYAMVAPSFGNNEEEDVQGCSVSDNFFSLLGVRPAIGQTLGAPADHGTREQSLVLSYAFWQRRFGGEFNILGRSLILNGTPYTIIGVMNPEFTGVEVGVKVDVWIPLNLQSKSAKDDTNVWLKLFGRLAPGTSYEQAELEFGLLFQSKFNEIAARTGDRSRGLAGEISVKRGAKGYDRPFVAFKRVLAVSGVIVGALLLICCANVAGLLLAQLTGRQREFAVKAALGASRARLMCQVIVESLVFACAGGTLGAAVAYAARGALAASILPRVNADFSMDYRVFLFTAAVAVGCGLLVGMLSAFRFSQKNLLTFMNGDVRVSRQLVGRGLVIGQISISVWLIVVASLFSTTIYNLRTIDLGFDKKNLYMFSLANSIYARRNISPIKLNEVLQGLEGTPGIQTATWSSPSPLVGGSALTFSVDGYQPAPGESMTVSPSNVGPRFFETMGITLLRGRLFTSSETLPNELTPANAIVIGESLARKYFVGSEPIGRRLELEFPGLVLPPFEIVGVVSDAHYQDMKETSLKVYIPGTGRARVGIQVKSDPAAGDIPAKIRALVRRLDPGAMIVDLRPMSSVIERQFEQDRSVADVSVTFSILALLLSAIGLYGLIAYNVAQRTREIGVRIALGARAGSIINLIVRESLLLVIAGCVIGLVITVLTIHLVQSRLYGTGLTDPRLILIVLGTVVLVVFTASFGPVRSAIKVDPMMALRSE
jgi:predicted permease